MRVFNLFLALVLVSLVSILFSSVATAWLGSYSFRREINCSDSQVLGVPIIINGSEGFDIGGTKQDVWINCSGPPMYLYYDSETSYAVADSGDNAVAFDVEFGNVTSANYTDVWGSITAYHLYDGNDSTDTYNLTYNGDGLSHEAGVFYNAAAFAGTDDYFSNSFTEVPTYYSIESWIKVTSANSYMTISHMRDTSHGTAKLRIDNTDGHVMDIYFESRDGGGIQTCIAEEGMNGHDGIYNHVVATWDGTNARIFRNGTLIQTCAWNPITGNAGAAAHTYGVEADGSAWDYVGSMDELREWNLNLTAEQVNATFQNRLGTAGFGNLEAEETLIYNTLTETYDLEGIEGTTHEFILNITGTRGNATANFTWNGTVYEEPEKVQTGDNYTWTQSITLPEVNDNANVDFNWTFNINTTLSNTDTHTFTILNVKVDNCSVGNYTMITFFFENESTETPIHNATIFVKLNLTDSSYEETYGSYFFYWNGTAQHNVTICSLVNDTQYYLGDVDFSATGYVGRSFHFYNGVWAGVAENKTLYFLDTGSASQVKFRVVDDTQSPLDGVFLFLLKEFPESGENIGLYRDISSIKTDDKGEGYLWLELYKYYKFDVVQNQVVISDPNEERLQINTNIDVIQIETLGEGFGAYWETIQLTSIDCNTTYVGNYTVCRWVSGSSFLEACLSVYTINGTGVLNISDVCDSTDHGSLSYSYPNVNTTYHFTFTVYLTDGSVLISGSGSFAVLPGPEYDDSLLLLVFAIVLTFAVIIPDAVLAAVLVSFALAACIVLGLFPIGNDMAMAIVFLGLFVGFLISNVVKK